MIAPGLALVVEDDEIQREMLGEFLRTEGMEVISCESAETAELIIGQTGTELRLVVTDFHLAGVGTGIDVVAFARDQFPHLRVILVSGDYLVVPDDVLFLRKPFDLREVLAA